MQVLGATVPAWVVAASIVVTAAALAPQVLAVTRSAATVPDHGPTEPRPRSEVVGAGA